MKEGIRMLRQSNVMIKAYYDESLKDCAVIVVGPSNPYDNFNIFLYEPQNRLVLWQTQLSPFYQDQITGNWVMYNFEDIAQIGIDMLQEDLGGINRLDTELLCFLEMQMAEEEFYDKFNSTHRSSDQPSE